jgi:hypothetical protein
MIVHPPHDAERLDDALLFELWAKVLHERFDVREFDLIESPLLEEGPEVVLEATTVIHPTHGDGRSIALLALPIFNDSISRVAAALTKFEVPNPSILASTGTRGREDMRVLGENPLWWKAQRFLGSEGLGRTGGTSRENFNAAGTTTHSR